MPSLYIVLDKKVPGEDVGVDGTSLSKHNRELEGMAKQLGVAPLMTFFSTSNVELASVAEELATFNVEEKWFTAEEGLRTVNALLETSTSQTSVTPIGSEPICENSSAFWS